MGSTDYKTHYSEARFWEKARSVAKTAGKAALEPALKMYYSATDKDTPAWAKATIYGALGYLISPLDAIPDFIPVAGYTDDIGILVAAMAAVAAHIKDEHADKARAMIGKWLGE